MLRHSFVHIPGIGLAREKRLWESGIVNWEKLAADLPLHFKGKKALAVRRHLDTATEAYVARDLGFFHRSLPERELWRLIPECLDSVAYLDIETTGLGFPPSSHSTTVTFVFQGKVYQEYEHEKKRALIAWIYNEASILCTFFGKAFDVPFLEHEFGIAFGKPHVDLCYWLRRLGYKGGLKRVQKLFPDIPERQSLDIDGFDAVRLWQMHRRGVEGALETLLTYNAEDTVVLEPLLVKAYNLEIARLPELPLVPLEERPLLELSTRSHSSVYARLRHAAIPE
ncbi:MAG: ribonuclease H-like domain-containing protein [Bdellovibrionota bacterium]